MRVLVAEDEVVSRRLLEASLRRWKYDVVTASDGLEAARILRSPDAPKLAVLDWLMPGLDGTQLCRTIRQAETDSYTYILLLTTKQTKRDVVEGLEAGADDYISKPFDPRELRVRLRTGKRILYLLNQLTAARETLRDLAARDPLTGLWNHSSIIELLRNELCRSERQRTSVGVVLVDLDHFKMINDRHGHLVGDQVLREASQFLRNSIRLYDAVGRLGGEEFLVVLPGCDEINATSHAERLRQALSQIAVPTAQGTIGVTASLGVTVVRADGSVDAQAAINTADLAMYAAKNSGRDRVEFFAASAELANV
jgi:two-component system, cell cycle response regulator